MNIFYLHFYLLLKEIRSNPSQFIKQWVIFSLVFSIVIILFIMPESYKFLRVAPYKYATYDFRVSGLLHDKEYNDLSNCSQIDEVIGAINWNGLQLENLRNGKICESNVIFENNINTAKTVTPNNNSLLKDGNYKKNGAVLTYGLSKKLGIKIGDEVQISWSTFNMPKHKVIYKITGISYETATGDYMIADINIAQQTLAVVSKKVSNLSDPPKYTYLYAKFKNNRDMQTEEIKALFTNTLNLSIEPRSATLQKEKLEVQRISTQVKYQRYGILLLYLLMYCGYTLIRIKEKERFFAIIIMLGAHKNFPYYFLILENFLLFIIITFTSVVVSFHYYKYVLGFYFPILTLIYLIIYATLINLAILLIASILGLRKLNKLQIVDILAKE